MEKLIPLCATISSNVIGALLAASVEGACKEEAEERAPTKSNTREHTIAVFRFARRWKYSLRIYAINLSARTTRAGLRLELCIHTSIFQIA
jgi:hypothetical protein